MKQVVKKQIKDKTNKDKKNSKGIVTKKRKHAQYGTSKLEEDFARDFLDKLGIEYVYQYEAKDIKRYFDFYVPSSNIILEIDGDFWHGNPEKYKEDELRGHQKRAKRIDEHKTKWALMRGIPILRFWESDIRKRPKFVLERLKEELNKNERKIILENNKKKRH
jgi:very-short-patch-repair endonuclease